MTSNIQGYDTIIFDCDGVILNSNKVKTDAFFETAKKHYGSKAAHEFVKYHIKNGGISRYQKFEYLLKTILEKELNQTEYLQLLSDFSSFVKNGLLKSEIATGLRELREFNPKAKWLVVSGGDQDELREVFKQRNIYNYFDGGIFGSPTDKLEILSREIKNGNISGHTLFLGDSIYDYDCAAAYSLDFLFISDWSEVEDWQNFCLKENIQYISKLNDLLYYSLP